MLPESSRSLPLWITAGDRSSQGSCWPVWQHRHICVFSRRWIDVRGAPVIGFREKTSTAQRVPLTKANWIFSSAALPSSMSPGTQEIIILLPGRKFGERYPPFPPLLYLLSAFVQRSSCYCGALWRPKGFTAEKCTLSARDDYFLVVCYFAGWRFFFLEGFFRCLLRCIMLLTFWMMPANLSIAVQDQKGPNPVPLYIGRMCLSHTSP